MNLLASRLAALHGLIGWSCNFPSIMLTDMGRFTLDQNSDAMAGTGMPIQEKTENCIRDTWAKLKSSQIAIWGLSASDWIGLNKLPNKRIAIGIFQNFGAAGPALLLLEGSKALPW